jgi:hypothetical protein
VLRFGGRRRLGCVGGPSFAAARCRSDGEARRIRGEAEIERQALLRESAIQAREQALVIRAEAEADLRAREAELAEAETALAAQAVRIDDEGRLVEEARSSLVERATPVAEREQDVRALAAETRSIERERQAALERVAALHRGRNPADAGGTRGGGRARGRAQVLRQTGSRRWRGLRSARPRESWASRWVAFLATIWPSGLSTSSPCRTCGQARCHPPMPTCAPSRR